MLVNFQNYINKILFKKHNIFIIVHFNNKLIYINNISLSLIKTI